MNKRTQQRQSAQTPKTFPCIWCQRIVRVGDKSCGFCSKPLQVQCPACGTWAQWAYQYCPQCSEGLHTGGRTFAQNQKLERLQWQLAERIEDRAYSEQSLDNLRSERDHAIQRCLVVGLVMAPVIALCAPLAAFLSNLDTLGVLIALVVVVVFLVRILALIRLFVRLCRWGSLGNLVAICKAISREQAMLVSLDEEIDDLRGEIADLENIGQLPAVPDRVRTKKAQVKTPVSEPDPLSSAEATSVGDAPSWLVFSPAWDDDSLGDDSITVAPTVAPNLLDKRPKIAELFPAAIVHKLLEKGIKVKWGKKEAEPEEEKA